MKMTLGKTIANLRRLEASSTRREYIGDATEYAFRRHILLLFSKKHKRLPSSYQIKVGKYMKEGKTIQEAHKLAKEENTKEKSE